MNETKILSRSEEKALVKRLTPNVAWPIVIAVFLFPALSITIIISAFRGYVPMWMVTIPLGYLAYAHYLFVHESTHGNIVRGRFGPLFHGFAGWVGSLALGSTWPVLRKTHLGHHRHVNSNDDPDIYVRGSFSQLIVTWIFMSFLDILPLSISSKYVGYYHRVNSLLTRRERRQITFAQAIQLSIMILAFYYGFGMSWLLLIYLPQCIGAFILHAFLQWAPHAPFRAKERYGSSRIVRWPAKGPVVLIENTHIFHHLWPQVPFYSLGKLSSALKPTLEARGVKPEGFFEYSDLERSEQAGPLALFRNFGHPNRNGTRSVLVGNGANIKTND